MVEQNDGELRERVTRLERANRRLGAAVAAAAVLLGTLALAGTAGSEEEPGVVAAREVVLRDAKGVARGRWALDGRDVVLTLADERGSARIALRVGAEGAAGVALLDPKGGPRAALTVRADGSPRMTLSAADGADVWTVFQDADRPAREESTSKGTESREVAAVRLIANETAVIQTLKNLIGAQETLKSQKFVDQDNDGQGEYGYFAELAGSVIPRGATTRVSPPMVASTLTTWDGETMNDTLTKLGYVFQMWLPDGSGSGRPEGTAGATDTEPGKVDETSADFQETLWCAYAWPKEQGVTGGRTFFVCQSGDVLATTGPVRTYDDSTGVRPEWSAAFIATEEGRFAGTMAASVAADARGVDGNDWTSVY